MGIIDLGNMKSVGSVPPEGAYPVTITKIDSSPSKDGKSTNLFITYTIESSPDNPEWEGTEFREMLNVQESTLWKVQAFLEAATGKEWREEDMQLDPDELIGSGLIVEGQEGEYNGRPQWSTTNYYPFGTEVHSVSE